MKVKKLTNILLVENVFNSTCFYSENFGFSLSMAVLEGSQETVTDMEPSVSYGFAILKNGDVEMMLQSKSSVLQEFPEMEEYGKGKSSIFYIQLKDIEELFDNIKEKVTIVRGLHETFYGAKEFYIKDPDGHMIGLAGKSC